jgi:SAM-dependent methyltransferase
MNKDMTTDIHWEKWGKEDPYFGVITNEKFRLKNLTKEAKKDFFESGKHDINRVINTCKRHFNQNYSPKKVLDFGCGAGRLVIPFSQIAEEVVGVDISESMLKETEKNCKEFKITNTSLFKSDDDLSSLEGHFNLIHSCIVFQHIPVDRGRGIFNNLLSFLEEEGICAIQLTYAKTIFSDTYGVPPKTNQSTEKFNYIDIPDKDPEMQMNPYNLNEIFYIIQSIGVSNIYIEFTDHGGELGVYLYFQKPKKV